MKYFGLIILMLALRPAASAQQGLDLFLLIGQSNMAGRGKLDGQRLQLDSIYMLDNKGQWVPATEPLHYDKSVAGAGLGATFSLSVRRPGQKIGLVPCAVGGTSIALWKSGAKDSVTGAAPYDDALARVKIALSSGRLKGILWHQGESDSNAGKYKTYEQDFENLLSSLAADLSINLDSIPIITGELGQFFVVRNPLVKNEGIHINSVLHRLAQKATNRYCVSAIGLDHIGDSTHFNTESLRMLGRRYAEAYQIVRKRLAGAGKK